MSGTQNVRVERDEKRWEVELNAEITADALAHYRTLALKEIGKNAQISGFRAGHIPEATLIKHFGENAILAEAAETAVKNELPELLAAQELNIVEAPRVSIETPKPNTPLAFTARAPLAPEVKLPDYHAHAKKTNANKKPVSVTDDEHKETITHLRRERARVEKIDAGTAPEQAAEESRTADEKDLPELDDEFVKTLGYDTTAVFSDKVREHLQNEKELQAKNMRRAELLETLVKEATIKFPATLTEYELDDMEARLKSDVERAGTTLEQYLSEVKKTSEQLRKEWEEAAEKRVKIRLILSEIARKEKIEPDEAHLTHEIEHAKKMYPQASPNVLHAHIAHALRNEKVLEWLEERA